MKSLFLFVVMATQVLGANLGAIQKRYPNCKVELKTVFPEQKSIDEMKKKFPLKEISAFYSYYKKNCEGKSSNTFVLSDTIRTHKQFVLVDIYDNRIQEIEVVKFLEPAEYKVRKSWLDAFHKTSLTEKSKLSKDIDAISGATLSGVSTKFLAWQALQLHRIIVAHGK